MMLFAAISTAQKSLPISMAALMIILNCDCSITIPQGPNSTELYNPRSVDLLIHHLTQSRHSSRST